MSGWRVDAWVTCPSCGSYLDGAAVFGEDDGDRPGIYDGLVSQEPCDRCFKHITISLSCET